MVTFKQLGLKMRRGNADSWIISKNGTVLYEDKGNKGQVMLAYLLKHGTFKNRRWEI